MAIAAAPVRIQRTLAPEEAARADFYALLARLYADAARNAPSLAERDHQMRQAARLNQMLRHHQ